MRKSKKMFACLLIGMGILVLLLSLIKVFPTEFMIMTGSLLIGWGVVDFLFEHFIHKVWRAKIMDEDERNILINGKAYTFKSEFSNLGLIALALYLFFQKGDIVGGIISVMFFLLSQVVYVISFKYFDNR